MKKLLMILAACATAMVASAAVKTQVDFESGLGGFTGSGYEIKDYPDETGPDQSYPFSGNNDKYCAVDADSEYTLTGPAGSGATCFDMYVQFPEGATTPDTDSLLGGNAKVAVYLDYNDNKVCVVHGDGSGGTTTTETTTTVNPGDWVRLTIVKVSGGYKVYIDETAVRDSAFAAISGEDPSYVDFVGCGNLDNYVARTTDPFGGAPTGWIANIGTDDPEKYFTDYTEALKAALAGATLTFADGVTEMDGTAEHPFEIRTAADLVALQQAVETTPAARAYNYVQTADIDMASAGAFAGIGTYSKVPTEGTPFTGTYDGQNHKISNVTRAGGDTQGIFNQVGPSGVIKNLVVENMTFDSTITGEYGCAIVGNAGGGATLRNLTATGTFGSAVKPSTHNMAGIVVRLSPGATAGAATTIDSCTNNATIYGGYTKLGGICAIVQEQTGFKDGKVVFVNCANNGTLVCKRTAEQCAELDNDNKPKIVTGNAGILGYSTANVELAGCYSNGAITNNDGANTDKDGALVGWAYDKTLKDNGGNSAPNNKKMIGYYGTATVTGFKYATVDNGVATTVTTLAKDTTYLLEGNVAASETPVFTLAANGDTIAFDTALGYTFAGTVAAGISGRVNETSSSTVTTYTMQQSFTITWKRDADTTIDTTDVYYGETPTHDDPTRVGYAFTGWDSEIVAATADATYTATWEQTAIPVEVATAKTLVSVPQNCKASELIDTSNREKDDMLQVLNKATQKYYQWSYDGNGGWTPNKVATVGDNIDETPEANTIDLVRGEAVWVTRKDASKEILLNAVYTDDPVTVEVIKGYNLVAPLPKAGVDTIAIDEVVADDSTGKDRVFIPAEGKAPYNLDFKDGNWGYYKYTIEEGQLKEVRVTDVAIPAGTGFFYINNGDGKKAITLGGAN